jgi:hypothetical protein
MENGAAFGMSGAIGAGFTAWRPRDRGEQNESESEERAFKAGRKRNGSWSSP